MHFYKLFIFTKAGPSTTQAGSGSGPLHNHNFSEPEDNSSNSEEGLSNLPENKRD